MIRYPVTPADLDAEILATSASWFETAETRTNGFNAVGTYDEKSGVWSRIKQVFMDLQHFKCGFCERRLERSDYGKVEHDVEHFRPKKRIDAWPSTTARHTRSITWTHDTGPAQPGGFHGLSYERFNYLISCKTCNSALKRNNFPIAGTRGGPTDPIAALNARELPDLIYPIGDLDTDPETIISFEGVFPFPSSTHPDPIIRQAQNRRAEITIDLFELDTRDILLRERSTVIATMHVAQGALQRRTRRSVQDGAQRLLTQSVHPSSPHTNCARSFARLLNNDRNRADSLAIEAREYADTQ